MKIGLQLWGVRDALDQNFAQTFEQIAGFGCAGVELFGAHKSISETKTLLDHNKFLVPGRHFVFDQLEQDLPGCLEATKGVGAGVVVCAWSKATPDRSWTSIADSLEKIAQACQVAGLPFAYHNHDHELLEHEAGLPALDLIAQRAPTVKFELDIAWLHAGGVKPASYLERYGQRVVLVHVKDLAKNGDAWQTMELGQGEVDLKSALAATSQTASQWWISEQDNSPNPLESTQRNLGWLNARN